MLDSRQLPSRPTQPANLPARERLIVALDFPAASRALALVDRLEGRCQWFKVGLELYLAAGNTVIQALTGRGHSVFLDLKLHDIPNTVAGAVRSVAGLGAGLLTLHAAGGPEMLKAAAQARSEVDHGPELLAVTVLTSMDQQQLAATGVAASPAAQALTLARMAASAGIRGFVCSPQEAAQLRSEFGPEAILVVPGIRPAGAAKDDQSRIATPAAAIAAGASYLVVGRPITQAPEPAEAAQAILEEIAGALSPQT